MGPNEKKTPLMGRKKKKSLMRLLTRKTPLIGRKEKNIPHGTLNEREDELRSCRYRRSRRAGAGNKYWTGGCVGAITFACKIALLLNCTIVQLHNCTIVDCR